MPKGIFFAIEMQRERRWSPSATADERILEERRQRREDALRAEGDAYLCGVVPAERIHAVLNGPSLRDLEKALFDTLPDGKRRKVTFAVLLEYKSGLRSVQAHAWIKQVGWHNTENQWEIGGDIGIPEIFGNTRLLCGHFIGTYNTHLRRGAFTFLNL